MIKIALLVFYAVSVTFNVVIIERKKANVIKKISSDVESKGFEINKKYIRDIFTYRDKDEKDAFDHYIYEKIFSLFPIGCLFYNLFNIQYLFGDYRNNLMYAYWEEYGNDIDFLKEKRFIIKNKDKQWLDDREKALKKLEKKYDKMKLKDGKKDSKKAKNKDKIEISKDDRIEELLEKQAILQEMIERKQSEEKNDNQTLKLKIDGNNND